MSLDLQFSTALICFPDWKRELCCVGQCQGCPCSSSTPSLLPAPGIPLLPSHEASCQLFPWQMHFVPVWGELWFRGSSRGSSIPAHSERTLYRGINNCRGFKVITECKNVRASQITIFYKNYLFFSIFLKQPKPESNTLAQTNIF